MKGVSQPSQLEQLLSEAQTKRIGTKRIGDKRIVAKHIGGQNVSGPILPQNFYRPVACLVVEREICMWFCMSVPLFIQELNLQ